MSSQGGVGAAFDTDGLAGTARGVGTLTWGTLALGTLAWGALALGVTAGAGFAPAAAVAARPRSVDMRKPALRSTSSAALAPPARERGAASGGGGGDAGSAAAAAGNFAIGSARWTVSSGGTLAISEAASGLTAPRSGSTARGAAAACRSAV